MTPLDSRQATAGGEERYAVVIRDIDDLRMILWVKLVAPTYYFATVVQRQIFRRAGRLSLAIDQPRSRASQSAIAAARAKPGAATLI